MTHPITDYRAAHKLTLKALGALIGVGPAAVCKWERNRVPAERVPELERITGIPRQELRPDLFGPAVLPQPAPEETRS